MCKRIWSGSGDPNHNKRILAWSAPTRFNPKRCVLCSYKAQIITNQTDFIISFSHSKTKIQTISLYKHSFYPYFTIFKIKTVSKHEHLKNKTQKHEHKPRTLSYSSTFSRTRRRKTPIPRFRSWQNNSKFHLIIY